MFSRQKPAAEDSFLGHETRTMRRAEAMQETLSPAPTSAPAPAPAPAPMSEPVRARAQSMTAGAMPSIISPDLKITGAMMTDGVIELNGEVEGPIYAREVQIGESARISGDLVAEKAVLNGPASGRITARLVHLKPGARFSGDIIHQKLIIDEGAEFEGAVHRKVDEAAWTEITKTFEEPGVELTDEAARAVAALKEEFLQR